MKLVVVMNVWKLRVIKEDLSSGKDVSSLDFLALSEIFKFKIE
eukprot:COSAG01_NODE_75967_length_191_cov_38.630435_1_plen_42_part_10